MKPMRILAAAWLLAACGAGFAAEDPAAPLVAAYLNAVQPGEQAQSYSELFPSVVRRVQRTYATDVDVPAFVAAALGAVQALGPGSGEPAAVFKSAINAALGTLDPHSRYLDAREQRDERDSSRGYGGLGMEVDMDGGLVRVVSPMDGMPAARAGLKSGDLIV